MDLFHSTEIPYEEAGPAAGTRKEAPEEEDEDPQTSGFHSP